MFETLFTDAATIDRYHWAPLHDERLSYLEHCARCGARRGSLRAVAATQCRLVEILNLRPGDGVSRSRIEAAAEWSPPAGSHYHRPLKDTRRRRFVSGSVRWLRHAGMLEADLGQSPHGHTGRVAAYVDWMRAERGCSVGTIASRRRVADFVFRRLDETGGDLDAIALHDIDRLVSDWWARGLCRTTIQTYTHHLRVFLRFAAAQGWCAPHLADGLTPPRLHPGESVPKGFSRQEVADLLASATGERPVDRRDLAILLLLATYGLRAGEVAALTLDDIDWRERRVTVRRLKSPRTDHYPLSSAVSRALARYLHEVRPTIGERTLFVKMKAPLGPLTGTVIYQIVRRRADRLGMSGRRRGPHAFRHGVAQHLLDQGLSMKVVSDYLGHDRIGSTATYAKVQLSALHEVGEIDLEGLL